MSTVTEMMEEGPPPILDAEHYEIINGVIVETPRMGVYENWIAAILDHTLGPFARANGLGRVSTETMFNLEPGARNNRRPDLAVEVVSPSNKAVEIVTKTEEYFRAGVRLVWVVFPEEQFVQVWDSSSSCRVVRVGQSLEGGDVVPGFQLSLAELFEDGTEAD